MHTALSIRRLADVQVSMEWPDELEPQVLIPAEQLEQLSCPTVPSDQELLEDHTRQSLNREARPPAPLFRLNPIGQQIDPPTEAELEVFRQDAELQRERDAKAARELGLPANFVFLDL